MVVLVTGGTGFIGAAVVRHLLNDGQAVRVLVRPRSDHRNLAGLSVERVEGDLTDSASLERAVRGVETVFHVAADYRLWVPDPEVMKRVNVTGSRDLLRAAAEAGVTRIVYTSSVATLGLNQDGTPSDDERCAGSHCQSLHAGWPARYQADTDRTPDS
ncbi:MAG: hopanoid-associated sugar epimerase [Rhodospirillaceae bacterium]|nr:MAG: hopanoid-associated sugar epimerase [Rhodospirillaceae bacterium]